MRVLLFLVFFWCGTPVVQAFIAEQVWVRGKKEELTKLKGLVNATNVMTIQLRWKKQVGRWVDVEWFERTLSEGELRRVVQLVKDFKLTKKETHIIQKERIAGRFLVKSGDQTQNRVQIDIAESGLVFVSFFTVKGYDEKELCFEVRGALKLVRKLSQIPGARKIEFPPVTAPPQPQR
jgi:hypothetical protein